MGLGGILFFGGRAGVSFFRQNGSSIKSGCKDKKRQERTIVGLEGRSEGETHYQNQHQTACVVSDADVNRGKSGGDLRDSNEGFACAAAFHLLECGSKSERKRRKEEENLSHGIVTWDCKLKLQSCIATSWSLLYLD